LQKKPDVVTIEGAVIFIVGNIAHTLVRVEMTAVPHCERIYCVVPSFFFTARRGVRHDGRLKPKTTRYYESFSHPTSTASPEPKYGSS
jgi:hypothetical protein